MNLKECIDEGLLVKIKPDNEKAKASLEMAEHKLGLAEKEFGYAIYESSVISAYAAMFHSARALLFRDGYKERSHYAIYVYLSEKYSNKIERKYLVELDSLRLHRHDLMYGTKKAEIKKDEAGSAISLAREFLNSVKKMIEC